MHSSIPSATFSLVEMSFRFCGVSLLAGKTFSFAFSSEFLYRKFCARHDAETFVLYKELWVSNNFFNFQVFYYQKSFKCPAIFMQELHL